MLKNVAVVVLDGFTPFELGVLCEVFGTDRTTRGCLAMTSRSSRGSLARCGRRPGFTLRRRSGWSGWRRPT